MSLLHRAHNDKCAALACYALAQDCLAQCGVDLLDSISETCAAQGVARSSVYECKATLEAALDTAAVPRRGRPQRQGASREGGAAVDAERELREAKLTIALQKYQLEHPGALVDRPGGHSSYSDGYMRIVLDLSDSFDGTDDDFCRVSRIPPTTLWTWRRNDAREPLVDKPPTRVVVWPEDTRPTEVAREIACEYQRWRGKLGAFLKYARKRWGVSGAYVVAVLRVTGMIPPRRPKVPRYRDSTERATPGAIVVTDGKEISVALSSGTTDTYNWQGIVDQATTCHLGVVVTKEEDAAAVVAAHEAATRTLGKPPLGLVHDQKPIHKEASLLARIGAVTTLIVATLWRPENKAGMEGEFGRFEREVGTIRLDDTSMETLKESAVREVLRAYTAGINHAPREELGGVSRAAAVAAANPGTEKDKALVARLAATHRFGRHRAPALPTAAEARIILDMVYEEESLVASDPSGKRRRWLADRHTPAAIRRAAAIFGAKRERGELRSETAERYLVKLITSLDVEISLEREERRLLDYAAKERCGWLLALEAERDVLRANAGDTAVEVLALAAEAVHANIIIAKSFWERELKIALAAAPEHYDAVRTRIRRIHDAPALCRRRLLDRVVAWQAGLDDVERP